jgi:hypothetical protein
MLSRAGFQRELIGEWHRPVRQPFGTLPDRGDARLTANAQWPAALGSLRGCRSLLELRRDPEQPAVRSRELQSAGTAVFLVFEKARRNL